MNYMLRRILNKLLNYFGIKRFSYINWFATWIFNLRCFDFKTALKLPVYIYNKVDIFYLNKVKIDSSIIYKGMIRIGCSPIKAHDSTRFFYSGTIIFHGSAEIWGGCIIEGDGILEFGNNVVLGESCKVMCCNHIKFNNYIRVGYECTFMDTDFHYVIDTNTNKISHNKETIVIGEGTWIASTCKIMKGSVIPQKSIVGGGSLINKDFSKEQPCQIYVGTPAKPIKGNSRRIFNVKKEDEFNLYFKLHPYEKNYIVEVENMDELCLQNFFRKR